MTVYSVFYKVGGNMFAPDKNLDPATVISGKNFMPCGEIVAKTPDDAFTQMQAEGMSKTQLEYMQIICKRWITKGQHPHTSMSVGDVLYDQKKKVWLQCDMVGWKKFGGKK